MFDLLKKKISGFIGSLTKREEEKPAEPHAPEPAPAAPTPLTPPGPQPAPATPLPPVEARAEPPKPQPAVKPPEPKPTEAPKPPSAPASKPVVEPPREVPKPQPAPPVPKPAPAPRAEPQPAPAQPKLSLLTKVKALLSSDVEIAERDVAPLLEELELSLLESDVTQEAAQFLVEDLRRRLVGKRVAKSRVGEEIREEVGRALADVFEQPFDLEARIREKNAKGEPFVILFVGPNGTGKTTLVAKLASHLKGRGLGSVIAAADTFRKGALEQAQEHGQRTGTTVITRGYGADPTSVAFDAVQHAKANKLDVVLVDTAGRQETSQNLVREMEKMNRVLNPDARLFVGEAIAGHALVEQVKKFHQAIGLDGIALTKIDCDAKGGGALSIAYETKLPLLFLGTGQGYGDFLAFDREWFAHRIAG